MTIYMIHWFLIENGVEMHVLLIYCFFLPFIMHRVFHIFFGKFILLAGYAVVIVFSYIIN